MKKIVRLTESDMNRLVRRVIKEQEHGGHDISANDYLLIIKGANERKVNHYLSNLSDTIRFITILNCEGADFSNIDICSFPDLSFVNLKGTPNNFKETVNCEYDEVFDGGYDML